jgi:hypothetical protein
MRYTDTFDSTALLFPSAGTQFPVEKRHVLAGVAVIDMLRSEGFGTAIAALRDLKQPGRYRTASFADCMPVAEAARTGLERRGYNLGGARCLERSLGMAQWP